jgi:hypothetical protein
MLFGTKMVLCALAAKLPALAHKTAFLLLITYYTTSENGLSYPKTV